ncbi:MAG TPA: hypothetical protein VHJ78_07010 [Actinomycetota bacterium]|nr:hypothetical protein [Actinomycetota bacterium]
MLSEWPRIEPEQDTELLVDAERTLIEFLRSLYIKGMRDPFRDSESDALSLICRN